MKADKLKGLIGEHDKAHGPSDPAYEANHAYIQSLARQIEEYKNLLNALDEQLAAAKDHHASIEKLKGHYREHIAAVREHTALRKKGE
jgi:hypothetical protein